MRTIISVVTMLFCIAPAAADSATRKAAEAAARQMLEDAYLYMGVAYLCEDALGSGHYYAARVATEGAARIGGKSDADAVIIADDFDKRIKKDIVAKAPAENQEKCLNSLLKAQTEFRVSKARFEKARDADK